MSGQEDAEAMRAAAQQAAREVLRELLPDMLRDALTPAAGPVAGNGNGNGHTGNPSHAGNPSQTAEPEVVPQVPAPPVAAVLRPSTWSAAPAPGEIVGEGKFVGDNPPSTGKISQRESGTGPGESVTIESDDDLNNFVRALAARLDNPRERRAIRTGRIRFTLRRTAGPRGAHAAGSDGARAAGSPGATPGATPTLRIEKGAVTERIVRQAADDGARLVLARGAVLTPLARDQAKALGVEIEKERTC